ncbi:unnamed protein product [Ilex paraguariensis]|uniref:R13L1/DRL21-like LRR repeat region domain-containing protein n=1 Tax=Ilex paraguariensis TaxID=185542 RepID=A0ABC8SAX6_9AQUA
MGLKNVRNSEDARSANLNKKHNLRALSLNWDDDITKDNLPDNVEEILDGLQPHPNLKELTIRSYPGLKFPNLMDNLSALKCLEVRCCPNLEHLPRGLKNLVTLERLELSNCDSLTSLPATGLQGLSSLTSLSIINCKKLSCLSDGVKYLTALQDLYINGCPEMMSWPEDIQHLNRLRSLRIWSCPNLLYLPDGLRCLHKLKTLEIEDCQHLERRCKKDIGEDWPKIAHVPQILIHHLIWNPHTC